MKIGVLRAVLGACVVVVMSASSSFADAPVVPVPEPASMTLLALGSAGMYLLNRRRS